MALDLPLVPLRAATQLRGTAGSGAVPAAGMNGAAAARTAPAGCRFCGGALHDFVDLGMSPLCESFLAADQLDAMEPFYPLKVMVCGECFLAQVKEYVAPEHIFREYAYFSSYSQAWLDHARSYAEMAARRFQRLRERVQAGRRRIKAGSFSMQAAKSQEETPSQAAQLVTCRSTQPVNSRNSRAPHCLRKRR